MYSYLKVPITLYPGYGVRSFVVAAVNGVGTLLGLSALSSLCDFRVENK